VEIEDHLSAAASLGSLFTHIGAPGVSAKILEGACRRVESVNELPWVAYVTLVNLRPCAGPGCALAHGG
jgi:hypothetical protein